MFCIKKLLEVFNVKNFVLMFLVSFIMLANISAANAEVVRVSDIDVQKFVHSMADVIYTEEFQKETPLLITNAVKVENAELPEIGKAAWGCQYGLKTADAPDGEILFFVDDTEKVSAFKIVGYSEQSVENATILLILALSTTGLTQSEAEFLLNNLSDDDTLASSVVWSPEINRCVVLIAGARAQAAEGFQFMVMATDKQN